MQNKNFRQKEEAIFEVYFDAESKSIDLTTSMLAKAAGVSRVTIYRHHRSACMIRRDYEWFLLKKYKLSIKSARETATVEQLLGRLLLFVAQNKRRFSVLMRNGGEELIRKMIHCLKDKLGREFGFSGSGEMVLNMYAVEAYELIRKWGEHDFDAKQIEQVQADLLYLAKTAPKRLGPVGQYLN